MYTAIGVVTLSLGRVLLTGIRVRVVDSIGGKEDEVVMRSLGVRLWLCVRGNGPLLAGKLGKISHICGYLDCVSLVILSCSC